MIDDIEKSEINRKSRSLFDVNSYLMFLIIVPMCLAFIYKSDLLAYADIVVFEVGSFSVTFKFLLTFSYIFVYFSSMFIICANLFFDSIVCYSCYGISNHHPFFNHLISLVTVLMPIAFFVTGEVLILASMFIIIAYSKFVTPIVRDEKKRPFTQRPSMTYVFNAVVMVFIFTGLLIKERLEIF